MDDIEYTARKFEKMTNVTEDRNEGMMIEGWEERKKYSRRGVWVSSAWLDWVELAPDSCPALFPFFRCPLSAHLPVFGVSLRDCDLGCIGPGSLF